MLSKLKKDLRKVAKKEKAKALSRFFKAGRGQYGEGDIFLGVMVPQSRIVAKKYENLPFVHIQKLLDSPIHEERLVALLILVEQYQKGDTTLRKKVFEFYIKNLKCANNWDLVDLSADKILGAQLFRQMVSCPKKMRTLFSKLSSSSNLWERRASIVATSYFIKHGEFVPTLDIAERLIADKHDLIHKAVGWMLREVGKRDLGTLESFLLEKSRYKTMPRTMLRYAIERFPEPKRKKYLFGTM
ncbi:MAG: DNA alkylation repair protein [Candidatus Yonathbacteria bacterium RIFCSPHIGHO2_01_FULL_44_41]|uniref:DNA alkylation repair protein n=1 Tax=Candidatus Yonathbacteria bacterium RIFCSPHIGHO2_02_FULL_44_14 TaxID=1802724 RepID=A0A1G2S5U1_9BACT|nr:MAG: DNA alkylation repair protein [Candidatus Yonathbacteria bacterium RIFCSPHIGHO2_01_FULL_44_41]OHA80494.1 MAG: DNA alkylation repair protein [Candidatus Yonathbacteria bacterium RIFCSPHIGHO2_02_FULL_44_14]OHA82217.1 MAG: DNA alkylation repair protein [Candidatus Yonathbacteria bacterium RIFCSPLOWO2_01_FULL_43_20]